MILNSENTDYLVRLMAALKQGTVEPTMDCPECDRTLDPEAEGENGYETTHVILTTWTEPGDYIRGKVKLTLAIGCEGYHIHQEV